jgi:cell division protein FtsB
MGAPAAGAARALRGTPSYRSPAIPRRRSGGSRASAAPARQYGRGAAVLDRLLRGNSWVILVGALLAGIVFLSVSVLELNQGIASTTSQAQALQQSNSVLRTKLAGINSAAAVQRRAEALGFVLPQPGEVVYLHPHPARDAAAAAARLAQGTGTAGSSSTGSSSAAVAPTSQASTSATPSTTAAASPPSAGTTAAAPASTSAAASTAPAPQATPAASAPSAHP